MSLFTTKNRFSARALALFTITAMLMSFLPLQLQVAQAATSVSFELYALPNPTGDDTLGETVIISNTSGQDVDLTGWKLVDNNGDEIALSGTIAGPDDLAACANTDFATNGGVNCTFAFTAGFVLINSDGEVSLVAPDGSTVVLLEWSSVAEDAYTGPGEGSLSGVLGTTGGDKIDICHATASEENPYVSQSPNLNSFFNGHDEDTDDIIPPFFYDNGDGVQYFPGNNFEGDFLDIYNNNCVDPDAPVVVLGCTDEAATNYDPVATEDDGSCEYEEEPILGCTDPQASNYNENATEDDSSCEYEQEPTPGTITIEKVVYYTFDAVEFDFTGDLGESGSFALMGGTDTTFDKVAPGTYDVFESPKEGWELLDVNCTDETVFNGSNGVTIDVAEGEDVTCVFFNQPIVDEPEYCEDPKATNYDKEGACEYEDNQCVPEAGWATELEYLVQGDKKNGSPVAANRSNGEDALGEPDWSEGGQTGFVSLGFGGKIKVAFDGPVLDADGDDISIHEATNGDYPLESAEVAVSQDGDNWFVLSEEARNDKDEGGAGVTLLDFSETGLDWILYVRVTDTSNPDLHNPDADGFDLDAVDVTLVGCDTPDPDPDPDPTPQCEIEGHKYDETGSPLKDWFIGLKKRAFYGEDTQDYTIMSDTTDEDGYYCLEWDEVDFSEVEQGYDSYAYHIFEKLQEGWSFLSMEKSKSIDDVLDLEVVAEEDTWYEGDEVGTRLFEELGDIIPGDKAYHVDFYNFMDDGYGPYCGDGVINQEWEQCELGDESCTQRCTFDNQCSTLQLAKINLDANQSASFDGKIYLGSASNPIPAGTWFQWNVAGDDAAEDIADVVDGLAVERDQVNGLQLAFRGGNERQETDIVAGSVELYNLMFGVTERYLVGSLGSGYELEPENGSGGFPDVWDKDGVTNLDFDMRADTGNDGATAEIKVDEEAIAECRVPYTLTVEITGDGFGTVSSTDANIMCSTNGGEENLCEFVYEPGTVVDLSAIADEGSNFDNSWTLGAGTCTGNTSPCQVTMNSDIDLVAHFGLDEEEIITTGGGAGRDIELKRSSSGTSSNDEEDEDEGPIPQVAGEQVSVVPAGAPNAGAGGTATPTTPWTGFLAGLGVLVYAASKRYAR